MRKMDGKTLMELILLVIAVVAGNPNGLNIPKPNRPDGEIPGD